MIATLALWPSLTKAMSCGRTRASISRLSSDGTISTSGSPGADRAAAGGDEHAVDPAGQRRAHARCARAGWRARAGRAGGRRARPGRWRARSPPGRAIPGASGRGWSAPRRRRRGRGRWSRTPLRPRSCATAAALSAWARLRRGSMPRSTSGRRMPRPRTGARRARRCAPDRSASASATARWAWVRRACAAALMLERSAMREACSDCSMRIWSAVDGIAGGRISGLAAFDLRAEARDLDDAARTASPRRCRIRRRTGSGRAGSTGRRREPAGPAGPGSPRRCRPRDWRRSAAASSGRRGPCRAPSGRAR